MEKKFLIKEEQERLNYVIDLINKKLVHANKMFKEHENFRIGFKEGLRGTQFIRQGLMSLYATEAYDLERMLLSPYFGRMDFKQYGEKEATPIYIGKRALSDMDNRIVTYDWRSPIANMYYDYPLGDAQYNNGEEIVKGELTRKRQPIIENGTLIDVLEQDTLTDDKVLLKYLNESADSRLKSIVATIQREQNQIIRCPLKTNYLIQGVAGSGKTTVALHRIAYLIYNEAKNINESEFMILGPNNYFLNYISELLPDLDIKSVSQSTFEDIAMSSIGSKFKLNSQNMTLQKVLSEEVDPNIISFKSSIKFLELLEDFVKKYIMENISRPIEYEGLELCSSSKLELFLNSISSKNISNVSYLEKIKGIIKMLSKEIKENGSNLKHQLWLRYRDEFLSLPKDSPRRREILDITFKYEDEIKNGCQKTLKEYFKFANINIVQLYKSFIDSLTDNMIGDKDISIDELKEYTLGNLNKKKLSNDDLAPLVLMTYLLKGINTYNSFEHLVIDEGQDLSMAQYYVLKLLFPKCTYDIYGDLNQSIYSYQGIKDWDSINKILFNSRGVKLTLNKGYRTTRQISDGANYVLDQIDSERSLCVARDGEDLEVTKMDLKGSNLDLLYQIMGYLEDGYKTLAVICKDEKETDRVYKELTKLGVKIHKISETDQTYEGGLCIMPSYLSKGLEFDGVIINDASSDIYDSDNEIDMKLLYVSMTRALHGLSINYSGKLTKPLTNLVEKGKVRLIDK